MNGESYGSMVKKPDPFLEVLEVIAMSEQENTRDEIIVMGNRGSPIFSVAIVALNQTHRAAGEVKRWIGSPLPLDLANELAMDEGRRLGLPVTIRAMPTERQS